MGHGGGANSSLHPPFRRKGGAPVPLHPVATGLAMMFITHTYIAILFYSYT